MTLIAALGFSLPEPQAILFGDLLLTGPISTKSPLSLPTQSEAHEFFGDAGWGIVGMCQKVCLLSDTLAVAWAGDWLGARTTIQVLRDRFGSVPTMPTVILDYLIHEPELTRHPASFVGYTLADGKALPFCYDAAHIKLPVLGEVCLAGSGASAVTEFASALEHMKQKGIVANPLAYAFILGSLLLSNELRGGDAAPTLRNMFGGGYEIIYLKNERLVKAEEVTYWLWGAVLDRASSVIRLTYPDLVVKQAYSQDHLLIRSATLSAHAGSTEVTLSNCQSHVVRPMFDSKGPPDSRHLKALPFHSSITCHCVALCDEKSLLGVIPYIKFLQQSDVYLEESNSKHHLRVSGEILEELGKYLRPYIPPDRKSA